MGKLFGADLAASVERELARLKESAKDRDERIMQGLTDEDDCFISMRVNLESQAECHMQLKILAGDGLMDYDAIFDADGKEVDARWVNTRYGARFVGRGVFASSVKALLKKTGWVQKAIRVPVWTRYSAGPGGGMCGVMSGQVFPVRWHTNMVTGEHVGFPGE